LKSERLFKMRRAHDLAAIHESGHAVVARVLGIHVISAVADEGDSRVRTRSLGARAASPGNAARILERLIIVDLAGPEAERLRGGDDAEAWRSDARNAWDRALRIIRLRRDLDATAELPRLLQVEALELVEQLLAIATALVEENWPAIERVAHALAGGPLGQAEIDALMALSRWPTVGDHLETNADER
jgi:hypothetical protein